MDWTLMRAALIHLLVLFPVAGMANGEEPVISLRADNWYPINGDPAAPRPGFAIEVLHEIWGAAGYRIDYALKSWSTSLAQARAGEIDCVVGAYIADAPDLLFPDEYLIVDQLRFYVRYDTEWEYTGPGSLGSDQLRLAIIDAYAYGEPVDGWVAGARPEQLLIHDGNEALDENLRAVITGDATALVDSVLVMSARLENAEIAQRIREAGVIEDRHAVYVACSPEREESREYLRLFDEGMRAMRASGRLAEILARYAIPATFAEHDPVRQGAAE